MTSSIGGAGTYVGLKEYEFTATSNTHTVSYATGSGIARDDLHIDNISVYAVEPTLGLEILPTPSFIKNPVYIDNQIPQYIDYSQELATNVMDSTEFTGLVSMNENVKILNLGTIFNSNKYVVNNPFGNENYEGCSVRVELYEQSGWYEPGWDGNSGTGSVAYGTKASLRRNGIVVVTGSGAIDIYGMLTGSGSDSYSGGTAIFSAPARVIVTYHGEAKNA